MTMILDGHIHIHEGQTATAGFVERLGAAGFDGGLLISLPPADFFPDTRGREPAARLDNLLAVAGGGRNLYPFYWIDPLEKDAPEQVAQAVANGVAGFKIICDRFRPSAAPVLEILREIAAARRPVLFHSGILWDGKPSASFNRPAEFEALLEVAGLRFSLAHISWPWCDECLAVYGKILNAYARRKDLAVEMFIDTTPGTPPIYREEALTKLFNIGYEIADNVIFGTDCNTLDYNVGHAKTWIERDRQIMAKLQLDAVTVAKVMGGNLERFVRPVTKPAAKKAPRPGE